MKEKILKALEELGFQLKHVEDVGYEFSYEGTTYLYLQNEKDEAFCSIAIPGICRMDEDNIEDLKLMYSVNANRKYVKAYKLSHSLWLFYERDMATEGDFKEAIYNMIQHLDATYRQLGKSDEDDDDEVMEEMDDED